MAVLQQQQQQQQLFGVYCFLLGLAVYVVVSEYDESFWRRL
jgi:hypothetical protein